MILWLLLVPILGGVTAWLFPRGRELVGVGVTVINLFLCVWLAARVMGKGGPVTFVGGGWAAPIDGYLIATGLDTIFLLTTAVTGMAVAIYAWFYLRLEKYRSSPEIGQRFWLLWPALLTGLNGVFLCENLLGTFLFLELIGGAAVGMVAMEGNRRGWAAALRYYYVRLPGSLGFFLGLALLYTAYGRLEISALGSLLEPSALVSVAAGLMLLGVVIKASLFPLHFWLPGAHSVAIGPASALLSGLVLKGPFYVALRLWFDLFPEIATAGAAQFIGGLGAAGVVWGAAQAMWARRLKMIIAYSTVSQMGMLFLLFPLLTGPPETDWTIAAWTGGVYQVMSHSMAKAALLMGAGAVVYSVGSDKLEDMNGIASRMPITTLAIAIACVTLIGLPPSGGFIAKWLLLSAAIQSGQWWWIISLSGGGLLTAMYAFRILAYTFRADRETDSLRTVSRGMEIVTLVLAIGAVVIGLRVQEPMWLIGPIADPAGEEVSR